MRASTAPIASGIYLSGTSKFAIQSTANVTGRRFELVSALLNTIDVIPPTIVLAGTTGGLRFDLCCFNPSDRTVNGFAPSLCFDFPQEGAFCFADGQARAEGFASQSSQ
jgi:hypothetical protein